MEITIRIGRSTAIVAMCLLFMLLVVIFPILAQTLQPRDTLAAWQPTAKPEDLASHIPTSSTAANCSAALSRSGESIAMGGTGGTAKDDPKYSFYSRGWNSEYRCWQISGITTQGYERIELSFATKGSGTGPKSFTVEYSTDGNEWHLLTDSKNAAITYTIDADNKFHRHGPFQLSAAINGLDRLFIRLVNKDTESVAGGTTQGSGTNYITDIAITGMQH